MKEAIFGTGSDPVRRWWISLISGIVAIVLGVCCLLTPDVTLMALSFVFVVMLLVSGLFDIALAASNSRRLRGWGWLMASGIMELLLGVYLGVMPTAVVSQALVFVVGFWILFRGFWALGEAYEFRNCSDSGWWLVVLAVLVILFAFVFLLSPVWNGLFLVWLVSFAFFVYGIYRITHAFALRSLKA